MSKVAAEAVAECIQNIGDTEALDATIDMSTDGYVTTTVESRPSNYQDKVDRKVD